MLLDATGDWEVVWSQPSIPCHDYNVCGQNAQCSSGDHGQAVCTCLQGTELNTLLTKRSTVLQSDCTLLN
jgi:hypothetical protein